MRRAVLPLLTLTLALLILVDRIGHMKLARDRAEQPVQGPNSTQSATAHPSAGEEVIHRAGAAGRAGETVGDRLARLATRERLSREASATYLDSLIVSTDSVVRRWPDRWGKPIRLHIVEGGTPGYLPKMAGFARDAFDRWQQTGVGLAFQVVSDSAHADVVIRWIDRFDFDRAGQTDLTWDQAGRVRRASISLALRTHTGAPLPDAALLSVAVHEAGHALGLPHSSDSNDVMFPATRTGTLTERDRRTIEVLYRLPPGPVRDELPGR
ncbi:MAG TPA: matrixin family metalloprotease [Gemmatimonadales bacterium]|nr:matrixin family metalloprotease [Gemmatimonadales bacterium]